MGETLARAMVSFHEKNLVFSSWSEAEFFAVHSNYGGTILATDRPVTHYLMVLGDQSNRSYAPLGTYEIPTGSFWQLCEVESLYLGYPLSPGPSTPVAPQEVQESQVPPEENQEESQVPPEENQEESQVPPEENQEVAQITSKEEESSSSMEEDTHSFEGFAGLFDNLFSGLVESFQAIGGLFEDFDSMSPEDWEVVAKRMDAKLKEEASASASVEAQTPEQPDTQPEVTSDPEPEGSGSYHTIGRSRGMSYSAGVRALWELNQKFDTTYSMFDAILNEMIGTEECPLVEMDFGVFNVGIKGKNFSLSKDCSFVHQTIQDLYCGLVSRALCEPERLQQKLKAGENQEELHAMFKSAYGHYVPLAHRLLPKLSPADALCVQRRIDELTNHLTPHAELDEPEASPFKGILSVVGALAALGAAATLAGAKKARKPLPWRSETAPTEAEVANSPEEEEFEEKESVYLT
jgi:hypothetical protein